jgi:CubicO group peptidase (beta-lactamase class C family)
MVGDGGVFTSVEDLVRWIDALNSDDLRPGLNQILEGTVPLTGGDENPYAFGQRVGEYRGVRTVSHGGAFVGFRAAIARFPDQGVGVATLCNRSDADPSTLSLRVADLVLAEILDPLPPSAIADASAREDADLRGALEPVRDPAPFLGTFYNPELDVDYVFYAGEPGGVLRLRFGPEFDRVVETVGSDHLRAGWLEVRVAREADRVVGLDVDAGRVKNLRFTRR